MDELFNKLEFNSNEKEVYLTVLRAGKIAPQRVSALTGINRTTVYSIARKLQAMGIIEEDLGQKVAYLVAVSPEKLARIFEKEEEKFLEKKKIAKELSKELVKITSEKSFSVPRIKFIEEIDLKSYLEEAFPRWQESARAKGNTWWGYQDDSFFEHYQSWIRWAWKQDGEVEMYLFVHDVSPTEDVQKAYAKRRHIKKLPSNTNFDSGMWIVGDYMILVQTKNRPHYLVEIYDEVLARNQKELFKALWEGAR